MLTLAHFLETLTPYQATGQEPVISSVEVDSRTVQPGSLFAAFVGEQADGHAYVAAAFAAGAVAALVERPLPGDYLTIDTRSGQAPTITIFDKPVCLVVENTMSALQQAAKTWRAKFPVRIIGVTGSVGKTTTKELIHTVLSQQFKTLKSQGNRNNEIGLPLTLLNLRPEHERAVLEMGMYATGEIALLCELAQPAIGVVTIIGPVHLERVGSMDGIVKAKRELIEALPVDGVAVLNRDDDRVMSMAAHTKARVFTYGLDERADLWASHIQSMGLQGVGFTLHYQGESLNVKLPMLGRHSVHTALRAAAVGMVEGMAWDAIVAGLTTQRAQLRLVAVPGPHDSILIDDTYNSSPDSALAALNLLHDLDGRRVAVLGDMLELGQVEEDAHRLVGRRVADVAQVLVAVGPRGRWIAEEALRVGMSPLRVLLAEDVETAVSLLADLIQANDIILIKGSLGMRMDRIVAALGKEN
ncbi:MAG: UDP-N-acetylmuramoyl-tripeptide--D-alanyl-D-alanine ligase [Anaerolineales bacterium]|nr:UDP-N-acetylmuramoyl-tripeptide--D-alanyl-D-alanine ligase [Anaerolineales bacterium]